MDNFLGLPVEIVLLCISYLDQDDISQLVRSCRHAQTLLTPTLYAIGYATALPWAATKNQKQAIESALKHGQPEQNVLFKALIGAAQHGHVEIAELLLDHGAPTELERELEEEQAPTGLFHFQSSPSKNSPLVAAIVAGYPATVSLLLARGAKTDVADRWGYFPLHHACEQRKVPSCVSLLLAAGANVDACSRDGMSAVQLAAGNGRDGCAPSSAILRDLLTATDGRILTVITRSGASIEREVISNGDSVCHRLVLEFGMPLIPRMSPSVLLLAAAAVGDRDIVKELLQQRDIDVQYTTDLKGNNAPMLAAKYGHSAVLLIILSQVARDIQYWRNQDGQTILHRAICSGNLDTVRAVAEFARPTPRLFNLRDRSGRTPLLLATECKIERLEVIQLLIPHGANIEVIDISGSSPLHNAARHGHFETMRLLLHTLANLPRTSDAPPTLLKPSARLASIWGRNDRIPDDDELLAVRKRSPQVQRRGIFDFGASSTTQPTYTQVHTLQGPLINLVDDNGFTPLALAGDHSDVTEVLIEHWAVSLDEARKLEQNAWFTGLKKAAGYGY
ncbi:ankyrin repeat-containing domain protein [Aspergillus insuetus]